MKNKEEPSSDLTRGNPLMPGEPRLPDLASMSTTGSTVRTDDEGCLSLKIAAFVLGPELARWIISGKVSLRKPAS